MHKRRTIILAIYYLLLLVSLHFPIGVLFLFSLNEGVVFAFPLKGLTVHWYRDMLGNSELLKAAMNSLLVALFSSLVATALGAAAAIALLRFQFKGKAAIVALALVPLLVPYLILGAALLVLFTGLGLQRSLWTVGAGHVVIALPYTLLVVMAGLVGFDKHLEEAAQDLGASYAYTMRRVILPLIAPAILAAWLVAFTVSFDEFILASFLIGRRPTLPVYLFGQLRFANRFPQVVALAVMVMAVSLSLVLLAEWLQRRGTRSARASRDVEFARPSTAGAGLPGFNEFSYQVERDPVPDE